MNKQDVMNAWNIVTAVINSSNLWSNNRQEAEQAASLLRETALKAIPEPSTRTATQIDHRARKVEIIAQDDNLELFATLMPYLLKRREGARMFMDRPSEGGLQYLTAINEKIAEILLIF
jgi:hypothetical protein